MASSSGGKEEKDHNKTDLEPFSFTTRLVASIIDECDEDFDGELEDLKEVELCLANVNDINERLNLEVQYTGISDGFITWTAFSVKHITQFYNAKDHNVKKILTEYVKEKKLKEKLKLEGGRNIDINIVIDYEEFKKLKKTASSHFGRKTSVSSDKLKIKQADPELKRKVQSSEPEQSSVKEGNSGKDTIGNHCKKQKQEHKQQESEVAETQKESHQSQESSLGKDVCNVNPDQAAAQTEKESQHQAGVQSKQMWEKFQGTGPSKESSLGKDVCNVNPDQAAAQTEKESQHQAGVQSKEMWEKFQGTGPSKESSLGKDVCNVNPDQAAAQTEKESQHQAGVQSKQMWEKFQGTGPSKDNATHSAWSINGANDKGSSVDRKEVTSSSDDRACRQETVKGFQVVLYVAEDKKAHTVKMEYTIPSLRVKKIKKMKKNELHGLWFSEEIVCPSNSFLTYAFDIFQLYDFMTPSFFDKGFRECQTLSSVIRATFGENDCLVDSYVTHVLHIIAQNKDECISRNLQEIDKFNNKFTFSKEKKMLVFHKLINRISESYKFSKAYCAVGYIFGKLDIQLSHDHSSEVIRQSALRIMESLVTIRREDLSTKQTIPLKYCAEQMCKRAYPRTVCILHMIKYCFHLFSSEYFRRLHKDNVFIFSSGSSDNDTDLCAQLFSDLAREVKMDVDNDTNHLFEWLLRDTPLNQSLTFHYEKFPHLVEGVDVLLKDQILAAISGLRNITMNWKEFDELCAGISKHPSLVSKYSPDLTKLALQFFRSATHRTSLTDTQMRVVYSTALFREEHDRETLLLVLSKSGCYVLHNFYLKKLDELGIENTSVIAESSREWLNMMINNLKRDEKFKTPAEYLSVLYGKLQELVRTKKVSRDEKLTKDLKEKVGRTLSGMDLELILQKSLERGFFVDKLFYVHLQEMRDDPYKGQEILRILEKLLSTRADFSLSQLKIVELGLMVLHKKLATKHEENIFVLVENWNLCVCAVNNSSTFRNNAVCKCILETRKQYWELFNTADVKVNIVKKLDTKCQRDNYIPLAQLFASYDARRNESKIVNNLKSFIKTLKEADEGINSVASVLQTLSESLQTTKIPGLQQMVKFVQGKHKDLKIGMEVQMKHIVDRSFFDFSAPLLSVCQSDIYLWKSHIFLKLFVSADVFSSESKLEGEGGTLTDCLLKLMASAKRSYEDYWQMVCTDKSISVAELHVVSGHELQTEVQIAEKLMTRTVPGLVVDALQLAGDYKQYMDKIDILKLAFFVLDLDDNEDTQFTNAVSAFTAIETNRDTITLKSLITASQTFKEINQLLDPETTDMLKEFSKSKILLEFIEEIQHEDLRNLIDAVEEHSEQSVQEITVSSLIDVRRFLRPLLENKLSNSVLELLKVMHNSMEENGLTHLATKLLECNTNLHSLISLYHNVANRGEATKDIVKALLQDENATITFDLCANRKVTLLVRYKGDRVLNTNELNDCRSRVLLLVSGESQEKTDDSDTEMKQFIEYVDSAMAISSLYEQLVTSGYPNIETTLSVQRHEITHRVKALGHRLDKWTKALEKAREKWYWLNHFYPEQITLIKLFLSDGLNSAEISLLFKSAGCNPGTLGSAQALYAYICDGLDNDEFNLNAIGATLEELMKQNIAVGQPFPAYEGFDPKNVRPLDKVQDGELYVINLSENSAYVIPTLMTLYRNTTGHIPCHHQVLFCSENTSWESITLFLNRTVGAKLKCFQHQLYCIVNVEKLRNEEQFKLAYKLKELGSKIQYLAVICKGSTSHPLINHFSENIHKLRPMLNKALSGCIRELWPDISVVTSDLPGQGKTELIQWEAFNKQLDMVSCHASGEISEVSLITRLKLLSVDSESLLHLDIGSLSNGEEADKIIFKLSVLGFLSSESHLFPRRTQHVCIEIANSINGTLQNSLPTTQYFEPKHMYWQGFRNLRVSQEVNSPVQVVCHYLKELSDGTLDDSDLYFTGDNVVEPIPEDQCRDLLRKQFTAVGDMSFSVLHILLNVLSDQLKKLSCSLFLRTSNLFSMIGTNTVKGSLLREILTVSTEFATRSVGICRDEQNQTLVTETKLKGADVAKAREIKEVATAAAMTSRVEGMIQWEESNHLIITFHNHDIQTFSALYRDHERVPEHVKTLFETQMNKPLPDFAKMTDSDLKERLQQIASFESATSSEEKLIEITETYAMTPDNLLKMILIVMRIKSHIPVIIMGETGCGKTSLLRYLANICDVHFMIKNIHAGIEEEDLTKCVQKASSFASENIPKYVWLFLDEINTCEHMGLLNDLLCHHVLNGKKLPPNLSIMAACNPYKLRRDTNILTAGLSTKVKTDEQSRLVYRVHPLPERMVDYVWDFGSLSNSDEATYISNMVSKSLSCLKKEMLVELLVMSQTFIRDVENSPYCVSLRDVNRCRLLIPWFREEMLPAIHTRLINNHMKEIEAVIMALAHSYHSRLNQSSDREKYREKIAEILEMYHVTSTYTLDCNGDTVFSIIQKNQRAILDKMELPDGIAKNIALQENVFVIFVCLLKHLPIFLVGKPGCSKSLSLQLLKSNLRGKDSRDEYFKKLPQLYYVSFQGSESSTSDGIQKVFDKAHNYRLHNKKEDVLPVIILDEIGLAEISMYNPLKVLHSLLEPENKEFPDVAVVGISNWALDAAKMNRAIHLSRPDMDAKELYATAVSIAEASIEPSSSMSITDRSGQLSLSHEDDCMLQALAHAYFEYVQNQKIKNFHGLRDFYSLVKYISRKWRLQTTNRGEKCLFVLTGLLRNFGGLESEIKYVIGTFNHHLKELRTPLPLLDLSHTLKPSLLTLIDENIKDKNARHLMLLTRGDSSLGIVEELLRSNGKQYMTILGSCFGEDKTDHYSYRILSKIILCMEQGITLILKNLETVYGSLYDMLNQNYTIVGKKKNCRIALGAYSNPLCRVEDSFRCIVLVEEDKVDLSDPPFLNRFEKQRLVISDVLKPKLKQVVDKLECIMEDISKVSGYESISPEELVPIYNSDMIPSLVHSQGNTVKMTSDDIEKECLHKIIILCTPEGIVRAQKSALVTKQPDLVKSMREQYFVLPIHEGLETYITSLMPDCENGVAAMIFTHSNIYVDLSAVMTKISHNSQFEKLGSFQSEKQLSNSIKKFWTDPKHDWFFIQVSHTDQQHFLLMKSILEHERKQHFSSREDVTVIKHVVVILHVDRAAKGSQMRFVNFLSGWHMAMVDCLDSHTIPLKRLLEGTLAALTKGLLQEKGISRQDLFEAFTCIHYTEETRSMESLQQLIDTICENDMVLGALTEIVEEWIVEMDTLRSRTDWQLEVACNTVKLKNFLTFHGALFEEVKSTLRHPLSAIVFTVEMLNGWDFLDSDEDKKLMKEKMIFWRNLVQNKHVLDISKIAKPKGPECYPCKLTTLQTKFPFSSFFIQSIEGLQTTFRDISRARQLGTSERKMDDTTCESLYKLFRRPVNSVVPEMFDYNYGKERFDDYFYDFCQWFTADLPLNMREDQRIEVISQAIRSRANMAEDAFDLFVTKLHVTGWIYKFQLHAEIILIDTCMSQLSISLADTLKKTYSVKRDAVVSKGKERKRVGDTSSENDCQENIVQQNVRLRKTDVHRQAEARILEENIARKASGEVTDTQGSISKGDRLSFNEENQNVCEIDVVGDNKNANRNESSVVVAESRSLECDDVTQSEGIQRTIDTSGENHGKDDKGSNENDFEVNSHVSDIHVENTLTRSFDRRESDESVLERTANDLPKESDHGSRQSVIVDDHDVIGITERDLEITGSDIGISESDIEITESDVGVSESDIGITESDVVITVDSDNGNFDDDKHFPSQVPEGAMKTKPNQQNESDTSASPEDELSDEGSERQTDSEDDSDTEDVVAASLVDLVCRLLVPSKEVKNKSVTEWQSIVNLVLSLTTDVSVQPSILEILRACNDLASMIILPHNIDEKHFWKVGNVLSSESLDSEKTVSVLRQFAMDVIKHISPHHMQHFLSSYASCCLMADTQSNFITEMFDINICTTGNINDVSFIGPVLHHAIFLQVDTEPEDLLKDDAMETDFFIMLNEYLNRSQKYVDDSSFGCVIVDLLQNHIFSKVNEKLDKDPQKCLGQMLELKRKYSSEQPVTMKSVIIIGYLKAALRYLASYICKKNLTENLRQKINQLFEGGSLSTPSRVQGLQSYFLKCLIVGGGLQACSEVKKNFGNYLEYFTSLDTLSDKKLQCLEHNPLLLGCTDVYFKICKTTECLCKSNVTPLHELFEQYEMKPDEIAYGLFAFALHEFFLIKANRNMKGTEEDLSRNLLKEASPKLPLHQVRLLSCLCQQEEFGADFMQLQYPSSAKEYHMISSVLHILSTIFSSVSNLDKRQPTHVFLECICFPVSVMNSRIPGLPCAPQEIHSFIWEVFPLRQASFYTFNCTCSCRLSFRGDCMPFPCPNCKKETIEERFLFSAVDKMVVENEDSSELVGLDSSNLGDTTDVDSSTMPEEIEIDSVSVPDMYDSNRQMSHLETVRHMTQVSYRIVQFIYFSCLTGGIALRYTTDIEIQSVLCLDDKTDPTCFMQTQLSHQWESLKTLLSMGDEQLSRFLHVVFHKAKDFLTNSKWHIHTKEEKDQFEQEFTQLVTPLVERRFQLIMEQVKAFDEICKNKEDFLQDVVCDVYKEGQKTESLQHMWREIIHPDSENMKVEFLLTGAYDKFPILSLVFSYEKELKLMKHIWSLLQWHICTVKHVSYRYKKKECFKKSLGEFKHSLEDEEKILQEVNVTYKDFTKAWEEITSMKEVIDQYVPNEDGGAWVNIHPNIELEKCIIMNTESQVFRVLGALIRMQNCFLDDAMKSTVLQNVLSSSFLIRSNSCASVPVVKAEDITKQQVVNYPDFEDLLKFSQCNTAYGHGREVVYDFYQIERDVAMQCLLKKAHIDISDSFPKIAFAGEIQHTVSSLLQEIKLLLKQEPLSSETEQQLIKMDPANRKVLMIYLEMTFCLLKRTPVSSSEKRLVLGDFLESWHYLFPYRVQDVDNFCNSICLCNTVALYELVEKHMAADVVESLEDKFRSPIPPEAQVLMTGSDFVETEFLEAVGTALSKYAYRHLQSSDVDPEEQLSPKLKDPSLWPNGVILKLNATQREIDSTEEFDLLPSIISVKHIYRLVKDIKAQIEKLHEKSHDSPIQQKKKVTKAKKSKMWKR